MRCKFFRLKTKVGGFCRVNKKESKDYPAVSLEDTCDLWQDAEQQYFIRLGWLKSQRNKENIVD